MDELTQLAHAARAGDERALDLLVGSTHQQVWAFCAAVAGDEHADRLAGSVYTKAVESLPRFWGKSEARTWLLAIARKLCLDDVRSRERLRLRDPGAESPAPAPASGIHGSLEPLDTTGRVTFALTQLAALSYEETASVCGCPKELVRFQMMEAREKLLRPA